MDFRLTSTVQWRHLRIFSSETITWKGRICARQKMRKLLAKIRIKLKRQNANSIYKNVKNVGNLHLYAKNVCNKISEIQNQ